MLAVTFRLSGARVLLLGSTGFVGSHVMDLLGKRTDLVVSGVGSKRCDLTSGTEVERLMHTEKPDLVMHLAGKTGGILQNIEHPGSMFYPNILMNTYVMEHARNSGVKKLVHIVAGCSYPRDARVPTPETEYWNGYPEPTSSAYSLAKKMFFVQSLAYRTEFGFNSVGIIPENVYGPRDRGFYDVEHSHVVAALIARFSEAKRTAAKNVTLWGDGSPTRSFLYVEDFAQIILKAAEAYDSSEPLNVGAGQETSIKQLANLIRSLVGFEGEIKWNPGKPMGQPRRCFDVSKSEAVLGRFEFTALETGLKKTIEWYKGSVARG